VEDADPEPVREERPARPAPRDRALPLLGRHEGQDVVAPVRVDEEEAAARTEDAHRVADLVRGRGLPRRDRVPEAGDDVRAAVRHPRERVERHRRDARARRGELTRAEPGVRVEEDDVAVPERPELGERTRDPALGIGSGDQGVPERGVRELDGEVGHRGRV